MNPNYWVSNIDDNVHGTVYTVRYVWFLLLSIVPIPEFKNGDIVNKQGENEGSAKIFSYAALSELDKETTLKLFGEHYRSVKENPDGTDHQNIRNFMKYGWEGMCGVLDCVQSV